MLVCSLPLFSRSFAVMTLRAWHDYTACTKTAITHKVLQVAICSAAIAPKLVLQDVICNAAHGQHTGCAQLSLATEISERLIHAPSR